MNYLKSVHNPFIKKIRLLQKKSRERKRQNLFVVEGKREILMALKGGFILKELVFSEGIKNTADLSFLEKNIGYAYEKIKISKDICKKITYRGDNEGLLGVFESKKSVLLEDLYFKNPYPLFLVIESVEKPGNIGALLRTAEGVGINAVFIANSTTDLFNPNIIRSSMGGVFLLACINTTSENIITYLKEKKVVIYSASLKKNAVPYCNENYTRRPIAIVVGAEASGLSKIWLDNSYKNITIPMNGEIDSLNVSVATGILLYEIQKQRNLYKGEA